MLYTDLLERADVGGSPVNTLAKRKLVEVFVEEVWRDPIGERDLPEISEITLTGEQSAALAVIESSVSAGGYDAFLLHGVTGSGKTEVYIRAMRAALDLGQSALMLV